MMSVNSLVKKWGMTGVGLVLIGTAFLGSDGWPYSGDVCEVSWFEMQTVGGRPQKISPYWNCPAEYKGALQTIQYLEGVYAAFAIFEGQNPATWDELAQSPYFVIPVDRLWNFYQNRPVRVIQGDVTVSPYSPGDIRWFPHPEYPNEIVTAVDATDPVPPYAEPTPFYFTEGPVANIPDVQRFWTGYDWFDDTDWARTATTEEKKLAGIATLVEYAAEFGPYLAKHAPIDWQDFQDIFYWASELKNPYTGQPLEIVSHRSPSPGNCTYAPEDLPDPWADDFHMNLPSREEILAFARQGFMWPSWIVMFCYNDRLEPVAHWKEDLRVSLEGIEIYLEDNPGAEGGVMTYIP